MDTLDVPDSAPRENTLEEPRIVKELVFGWSLGQYMAAFGQSAALIPKLKMRPATAAHATNMSRITARKSDGRPNNCQENATKMSRKRYDFDRRSNK